MSSLNGNMRCEEYLVRQERETPTVKEEEEEWKNI
jgi:hypothetical protein